MLLYVYRLRRQGQRQSRSEMAREGVRGNLQLLPTTTGYPPRTWLIASLKELGTRSDLLPQIDHARVVRVRQALTITGFEAVPRGRKKIEHFPQTWVCSLEVISPESWPAPPGTDMRALSGFAPEDDDEVY